MQNYTTKHTATGTVISANIKSGGFSEVISYEFAENISDFKIAKVYDGLTTEQQEGVARTKQMFKQFVRAIKMAYPTSLDDGESVNTLRADEAKRLICKAAKVLGYDTKAVQKNTIAAASIRQGQRDALFINATNTVVDVDEKLVYNESGDYVVVVSLEPVTRAQGLPPIYVYGMFAKPAQSVKS